MNQKTKMEFQLSPALALLATWLSSCPFYSRNNQQNTNSRQSKDVNLHTPHASAGSCSGHIHMFIICLA